MKTYDKENSFHDGLAAVNVGFKDVLTDRMYDPREGYMRETISEGKWGYINEKREEVIPVIYNEAGNFSEGIALVKLKSESFFIDKTGKRLFDFKYDYFGLFRNGLGIVRKSGKYGFINLTGQEIIPLMYQQVIDFTEGIAPAQLNNLWGYINTKNETVIPFQYSDASAFYMGLAKVQRNGKFGCINPRGKEIFPCQFTELKILYAKVIETIQNEKYIYYNLDGKQITPSYNYSTSFYNSSYCIVGKGDSGKRWWPLHKMIGSKWGVIDKNGIEVVPLVYDSYEEAVAVMKNLK